MDNVYITTKQYMLQNKTFDNLISEMKQNLSNEEYIRQMLPVAKVLFVLRKDLYYLFTTYAGQPCEP